MVQKRRFDDEEVYTVSCKHLRHVEHSNQMVSILEFVPSKYASHQLHTSGHDSFKKNKIEVDELFTSDGMPEIPTSIKKDIETSDPGCICDSSWATNSRSEADVKSEAPFENVLFSTEYCSLDRQIKTSSHSEENYSLCLEYPTRKPIPIGPDHQAIIPDIINNTDTSDPVTFLPQNSDDEKKLIGICVIPMPDSELPVCSGEKVGNGRTDCSCQDAGSVRCTRQHITKAREKIKETLGQKMFVDLGFYDMGEEVAEKWSLFHTLRALRHSPSLSLYISPSMAAVTGASISMQSRPSMLQQSLATTKISSMKSLSFPCQRRSNLSLKMQPLRFRVSCAAKPETVEKVCEIVRKQLAVEANKAITGETKFAALGADSLDTVEIVMGLEEEFGISVEEESAQTIASVQDAADLIEKLIENKSPAASPIEKPNSA